MARAVLGSQQAGGGGRSAALTGHTSDDEVRDKKQGEMVLEDKIRRKRHCGGRGEGQGLISIFRDASLRRDS